jgi:integrase
VKSLRGLSRKADLSNPEAVKVAISRLSVTEARKENLVCVYTLFCKENSIEFSPPRYHRVDKLPFIPLEGEVDQLVAGMGKKHSTYLQGLKELGCRAGELWNLKWDDLDLEARTANITPEKGSSARQLKISNKLVGMLNTLPRKGNLVFGGGSLDDFARWFYMKRAQLASKLNNPRIRKIGFKTLRHWKASTLYRQTRDILLVKQMLGHRDIRNTLIYTHLLNDTDSDWVCKTAKSLSEASSLIEAGFDYVTELEGIKLFRKRK